MDNLEEYCTCLFHTVQIVLCIILCFESYFTLQKMIGENVREVMGSMKLNGVDTQIAIANFSEIRRLCITQNGKFSLLLKSTSSPAMTSYELPVVDVQTIFGSSNIIFDAAAKHFIAELKLLDKPLLIYFGILKITYAEVQSLTNYIATNLLPGIDEF
ncbi:hypothetical protein T11_8731 [Trichinella zimbabwensis]|uniref:Uncharacterized protein n=1 Tax=Trichinella zimbabwensis TaxID=268475 RepID=A0A0V1H6V5_9BILA|nr:hypothetical protein T11_8731 [Trichinella zimbabwensis]